MPNDSRFDHFEKLLNAYMAKHGLNDAQLSDRLKSKTYINKIRSRRQVPGTRKMEQLAEIFGVTLNDLGPNAPLPDMSGGALSDRGRAWDDGRPAPASGLAIAPAQLRDVYVSLVRAMGGDDAAASAARADFAAMLAHLSDHIGDEEAGGDVTSRLAEYLLVAAAGDADVATASPDWDLPRWRRLARQSAQLLAEMAAPRHTPARQRRSR